jgi:hypothetical protein
MLLPFAFFGAEPVETRVLANGATEMPALAAHNANSACQKADYVISLRAAPAHHFNRLLATVCGLLLVAY